jgi:hypothetical protein
MTSEPRANQRSGLLAFSVQTAARSTTMRVLLTSSPHIRSFDRGSRGDEKRPVPHLGAFAIASGRCGTACLSVTSNHRSNARRPIGRLSNPERSAMTTLSYLPYSILVGSIIVIVTMMFGLRKLWRTPIGRKQIALWHCVGLLPSSSDGSWSPSRLAYRALSNRVPNAFQRFSTQ